MCIYIYIDYIICVCGNSRMPPLSLSLSLLHITPYSFTHATSFMQVCDNCPVAKAPPKSSRSLPASARASASASSWPITSKVSIDGSSSRSKGKTPRCRGLDGT